MKSKPVVMEHFSTVHTSFVVDFTFTNNITILMGDSGTGRQQHFHLSENVWQLILKFCVWIIMIIRKI